MHKKTKLLTKPPLGPWLDTVYLPLSSVNIRTKTGSTRSSQAVAHLGPILTQCFLRSVFKTRRVLLLIEKPELVPRFQAVFGTNGGRYAVLHNLAMIIFNIAATDLISYITPLNSHITTTASTWRINLLVCWRGFHTYSSLDADAKDQSNKRKPRL